MQTILNNNAPVAQGIEQLPSKQWVRGSIPRGRANIMKKILFLFFILVSSNTLANTAYDLYMSGNKAEGIAKWQDEAENGNSAAKYVLSLIHI